MLSSGITVPITVAALLCGSATPAALPRGCLLLEDDTCEARECVEPAGVLMP